MESSLVEITAFLKKNRIPYMVIGGIANLFWGEPRTTLDVDITIWVDEQEISSLIQKIKKVFSARVSNPREFVEKNRVLPILSKNQFKIDIIFAILEYEKQAIQHSVVKNIAGQKIHVCSPEDFVIHKIISEREKDREDVQKVLSRKDIKLNYVYLDLKVKQLAEFMERPDILKLYKAYKHTS